MKRRTLLLATMLLVSAPLSAPSSASADMAPSPPAELDVIGRATTSDAPTSGPLHAQWELRNRSGAAMHVRLTNVVLLYQGMRLPLRIVSVTAGGQAATRELDIPAGQGVVLDVALEGFSEMAAREDAWRIELGVDVQGSYGGRITGLANVTRSPIHAARAR
jgi:hypothetical protein